MGIFVEISKTGQNRNYDVIRRLDKFSRSFVASRFQTLFLPLGCIDRWKNDYSELTSLVETTGRISKSY